MAAGGNDSTRGDSCLTAENEPVIAGAAPPAAVIAGAACVFLHHSKDGRTRSFQSDYCKGRGETGIAVQDNPTYHFTGK